jgi:hypothetical protein
MNGDGKMLSGPISPKRDFKSFGPKSDLRGVSALNILDIKIALAFISSSALL